VQQDPRAAQWVTPLCFRMDIGPGAFGDNLVARTYRLSEAGRAERVERMKRLNADPVFAARRDALSGERMKHLRADPVFAAKQAAAASEAMKRLNADPVLAARKAAAHRILAEAIIAALRVDPNATRIAKQTGVGIRMVSRIAKAAGVKLTRGRPRRNRSEPDCGRRTVGPRAETDVGALAPPGSTDAEL
jgi:hypothetical protein